MITLVILMLGVITATSAAAQSPIEQAYARELEFLEAQRAALKARLAQVDSEGQQRRAQAEKEVIELEGKMRAANTDKRTLDETREQLSSRFEQSKENQDNTLTLLKQIEDVLGIEANQSEGQSAAIRAEAISAAVMKKLQRQSQVTKEPGAFFRTDGTQVQGEIVRVGAIATYGVSDGDAGMLVPAGEDMLTLVPDPQPRVVRAFVQGETLTQLPMFLHEGTQKTVEIQKEKTFTDTMAAGGPIGFVILGLGVLGCLMIVVRAVNLRLVSRNAETRVAKRIEQANRKQAWDEILTSSLMDEVTRIDRFSTLIPVIAAVAPLLGLLGTVTGMISTFDLITQFGTGDPKLLSSGISVALVTTMQGLSVAIPILLLGNMLSGWGTRMKNHLEGAAIKLTHSIDVPAQGVTG